MSVAELFRTPPHRIRRWPAGGAHARQPWRAVFAAMDRALHGTQGRFPGRHRARAEAAAERFVSERLNGTDGLGGIFPAMANAVLMYHCLGVPPSDPRVATAWKALERLVHDRDDETTYVQPCLSPVWDTALAAHALLEAGGARAEGAARRGLDWLLPLQVNDVSGDWAALRPGLPPGGWAFQYANPHYPDVDDTAAVVLAMDRARRLDGVGDRYDASINRATHWVLGMQSRNGGWGAFDADNTHHYLNHIPFADHGALLDPPTADVSGRCLAMLAQLGHPPDEAGGGARGRVPAARAGGERRLVRPLGRELRLRHLVGAHRAQRRRPAARAPRDAPRGGLAEGAAEPGWRLGRGRLHLSPPRRHPRRTASPPPSPPPPARPPGRCSR